MTAADSVSAPGMLQSWLYRPLIPAAFVANLYRSAVSFGEGLRSARVSRPRRLAVSFGEGLPTPPFGRPEVSRCRTDGRGLGDHQSKSTGGSGDHCPDQPSRSLVQAAERRQESPSCIAPNG